jgi:hypothetical protein
MKILLIQENGHHQPNRILRECFSWQRALQEYGDIDVHVWGQRHANFQDKPDFKKFDVIVCMENYDGNNWVPHEEIAQANVKKYVWAIDSHSKGIEYFRWVKNRGKYQTILCSIKHHVGENDVWFPNAYDDHIIKPLRVEKRSFIGFCGCGSTPQRVNMLQTLKTKYPEFIFDDFVIGDAMVESINSFELHFNFNVMDDINYRNFETIGCNIPLITNYNYQYDDLGFKDGKNCIFYKDMNELYEKIDYYKQNKQLLPDIASNGYKLSKKHSYRQRIKYLLKHINA